MKTSALLGILTVWLGLAVVAVLAGLLRHVPPPAVILGLTAAVLVATFAIPSMRNRFRMADLRSLLLPHLIRFVGIAFLVLVSSGDLPPEFAPVGWGDLIAALGAVLLLMVGPPSERSGRWWVWMAWNVFGLADMVSLLVTAVRVVLAGAGNQFELFQTLPFGLLPTFAVPLIIATHILIFVRLFGIRRTGESVVE